MTGLDGCHYLDNAQQLQRQRQHGDVTFNSEVDRVFVNAPAEQRWFSEQQRRLSLRRD